MLTPKTVTWIVVADGARARILVHDSHAGALRELAAEARERPAPRSAEIGSDEPGRTYASARGGARHALEPRSDPHREEERLFARELAGRLDAAARDGRFDKLALVAPAKALGDLRGELAEPTRRRVVAELHKELTGLALPELKAHLAKGLAGTLTP